MSDIKKRVLTGLLACSVLCLIIEYFTSSVLAITFVYYLACSEYFSIAKSAHERNLQVKLVHSFCLIPFSVFFIPLSFLLSCFSGHQEAILLSGLYLSTIFSILLRLFEYSVFCNKNKPEDPIRTLSFSVLTVILTDIFFFLFFAYPFCFSILLINLEKRKHFMFLWFFTTFQSDNGALLFGRLFGSFHPFPHISPAKSIQGVVGAFVLPYLSLIPFTFIGETRFTLSLSHFDTVIISISTGFLAFGGDLTESFLKRVAGVKDSGNLFPGHGGILDRLDSLVWVAPFIYYYSSFINQLS